MDQFESAKQFFLEGLRLLEANNIQAAETQFARSLEIIPDRVSTLNNLSVVKIRLEKFAEAEELARKAIAAEEKSPEAWSNLGIAFTGEGRYEEALPAYDRALNCDPAYARAWLNKAMTLLALKRYDEALPACDHALKLNPGHYEVLYTKSRILKELGRLDEAQKIYQTSLEMRVASSPVYIAERRATQKADVLILSHNPVIDDSLNSFEALHGDCLNYPGQLAIQLADDFHFSFVFVADAMRPSSRKQIPQPDLLINNCANAERILSQGILPGLVALVDSFGVPIINHPSQVIHTTRDASARLLNGVAGVRVPRISRVFSAGKTYEELAREIEAQFDYPIITRTPAAQIGIGMNKVDSREALFAVLASGLPEKFFVMEFVDTRGGNRLFRKLRAAIVKDEIIIVRVDFSDHWMTHGRRTLERVQFYLDNAHVLEEEKQICKDPEAGLGRSAIQALQAIRDRIPLDVFGIDFGVDTDGQVVFYEANATMNLLTTSRKEVPNPKEPDDRLMQAFQHYLTSLAARR